MSIYNFSTVDTLLSNQPSLSSVTTDDFTSETDTNMTILPSTYIKSIITASIDIVSSTTTGQPPILLPPEPQSILYKYLKLLCEVMTVYFTPIITIAGTIGNVLSVMVFFCTKLKKLSSSYYLAFLAFFDTGFLWCNFTQWLSFLDIHLYKRDGFCQLFTWLSNACSVLSVWFVVAFTMERFVAVMYPLKRPTICTVRRARCIVFYLVLFNAINSSPLLLFATSKHSNKSSSQLECAVDHFYEVRILKKIFFFLHRIDF